MDRHIATIVAFITIAFLTPNAWTQNAPAQPTPQAGSSPDGITAAITVEAEDAVSTNFAAEPVLLFGAGNNRTLQLNQQSLIGDTPYYAEYAVYAPSSGSYEFWYGGSIPGSREPLLPSYGSPLVVTINDQPEYQIFWEDVAVGPTYSSPYRWVRTGTVDLQQGLNQVRIEVRERRRYDGRLFLYLDRLAFRPATTTTADQPAAGQPTADRPASSDEAAAGPSVNRLPATDALQTEPESIEDLLVTVRDQPDDVGAWVRLADLYTLVGDHINAIRYLNRAAIIDDRNPAILGLLARNLLWRGDVNGALDAYWRLLSADPNNLTGYLEAGKIAAWNGFYGASEQYYLAGLATFPDNLALRINLGFTYLWWNQTQQATEIFQRAESAATTAEQALLVAREYRINDEPRSARRFLEQRVQRGTAAPAVYAELYDLLRAEGQTDAAATLAAEARGAVDDPEALAAQLERVNRTYQLRDDLVTEFEQAAADRPLDPAPRRTLAQTYLWIGREQEGIAQYEYLLALDTLNGMRRRWSRDMDRLERAAVVAVAEQDLRRALGDLTRSTARLATARTALEAITGDAPAEERDRVFAEAGAAATAARAVRGRISELVGFVQPRAAANAAAAVGDTAAGGDQQGTDPLQETLTASREAWAAVEDNSAWSPSLMRTRSELLRADGVVPGVAAHAALLTWIIGDERPVPPEGILVGAADPVERLLLVWAWAAAGDQASLQRAMAALPPEAGQLLVYQELYATPDGAATTGSATGPADVSAAGAAVEPIAVTSVAEGVAALDDAGNGIPELQQSTAAALRALQEERSTIGEILRLDSLVGLFELQNQTVALRTQLGRFYVNSGEIARAIVQFETVQEVDPANLDTLFALADAYQQQGRWARATDAYARIYAVDPTYRNVAAIHNSIARANADILQAGMRTVSEPTRVVLGASVDYTWKINSLADVRVGLDTQGTRLRATSDGITRRQYFEQGLLTAALPLRLWRGALVIEPQAGLDIAGNQLFLATFADQALTAFADLPVESDAGDYFQNWTFEPVLGVGMQVSTPVSYLSATYRYGPYRPAEDVPVQTALASRPEFISHSVNATLSTNLQNRPSPFWSRLRTTSGGSVDLIRSDGSSGQRFVLQQDLDLTLLSRSQPFTRIATGVSMSFENFANGGDLNAGGAYDVFYRPDEVLQLGGSLSSQLYRSAGRDTTVGLVARVYGGLYQQQLFDPGRPDPFALESAFRAAGDLTLELTRRSVAFQLASSVSRVWDGDAGARDFYSVGVALNAIVRNPSLLAP